MKRSPIKRKAPMRRGRVKAWNSTLGNASPKRKAYLRESKYSERSKAAQGQPCAVRSPICTGAAQGLHHILSRGAAGGLEAAERLGPKPIPACNACNEYVEGKGRAWAKKRGLRMTLSMLEAARERYGDEGLTEYIQGAIEMNREEVA